MYQCDDCHRCFSTPKTESAESYYGVAGSFSGSYGHTVSSCPYCGGNYKKLELCPRCECDYVDTKYSLCHECVTDTIDRFKDLISSNFCEEDYDIIFEHIDSIEPFERR